MTSYTLQKNDLGSSGTITIGVYTTQLLAEGARDTIVAQDLITLGVEYPTSTFDTINSNDDLITFIRKSDTISYNGSFLGIEYPEAIFSTSQQTSIRTYGIIPIVNP